MASESSAAFSTEMITWEFDSAQLDAVSERWDNYEKQIQLLEHQLLQTQSLAMDKMIFKDGIKVQIGAQVSVVEFLSLNQHSPVFSEMQTQLLEGKNRLLDQAKYFENLLREKDTQIQNLNVDLSNTTQKLANITSTTTATEDQYRKDALKTHHQIRLLNDQIIRLSSELETLSRKSTVSFTSSLHSSPLSSSRLLSVSISSQTDQEGMQMTPQNSRKSGVQILRVQSNLNGRRAIQLRQVAIQTQDQKKISSEKMNSRQQQLNDRALEQNNYLRKVIQGLNQQLDNIQRGHRGVQQSRNTQQTMISSVSFSSFNSSSSNKANQSPQKMAILQQNNLNLTQEVQRLKKDLITKANTIFTLQSEIKKFSLNSSKREGESVLRNQGETLKCSRQIEEINRNLLKLQQQNKELQRKLDDEKKEKNSLYEKHSLELNQLREQKKDIQRERNILIQTSKEDRLGNIGGLGSQILRQQKEKLDKGTKYVSISSYNLLRQEHEKEKKSLTESRDKYRLEASASMSSINKMTQQAIVLRNQKSTAQRQLVRLQNEGTRLGSEIQRLRIESEQMSRKLRQNQLSSLRTSRSVEESLVTESLKKRIEELNDNARALSNENLELKETLLEYKQLMNNRNLTILSQRLDDYEAQIKDNNLYIGSLLDQIAHLEYTVSSLQQEIPRLNVTNSSGYNHRRWNSNSNDLDYEKKISQKLSQQVKELKEQNQNLMQELEDKERLITTLNIRLSQMSHPLHWAQKTKGRSGGLEDLERQYNQLLSMSRDRMNRMTKIEDPQGLKEQLEDCRHQLNKALQMNTYLQQCLHQKTQRKDVSLCSLCSEYQQLVIELQRRINIYEMVTMGELRRILSHTETKLSQTGHSWAELENTIYSLRRSTSTRRIGDSFQSERHEKYIRFIEQSPLSASTKRLAGVTSAKIARRERRLDDLIKYDRLNFGTLVTLMLRICDSLLSNYRVKILLPDCIYILHLDTENPSLMKVELVEPQNIMEEEHKLYMSPEALLSADFSPPSLVWNLGTIFHLILCRKSFFKTSKQITEDRNSYSYPNKDLPQFGYLLEGMIQRNPEVRLKLQEVRELLSEQLERMAP